MYSKNIVFFINLWYYLRENSDPQHRHRAEGGDHGYIQRTELPHVPPAGGGVRAIQPPQGVYALRRDQERRYRDRGAHDPRSEEDILYRKGKTLGQPAAKQYLPFCCRHGDHRQGVHRCRDAAQRILHAERHLYPKGGPDDRAGCGRGSFVRDAARLHDADARDPSNPERLGLCEKSGGLHLRSLARTNYIRISCRRSRYS